MRAAPGHVILDWREHNAVSSSGMWDSRDCFYLCSAFACGMISGEREVAYCLGGNLSHVRSVVLPLIQGVM